MGMITHYHREQVQVQECPRGHQNPAIVSYKVTEPEEIELYPGIVTRNPARLVGWDLACGCFLSGKNFALICLPDQLPEFVRVGRSDYAIAYEPL